MTPIRERKDARGERDLARLRLSGTLREVRRAAAPAALIELAKNAAKARAVRMAVGAVVTARKRPLALVGAAIASLHVLFRKPLAANLKRRFKDGEKQ